MANDWLARYRLWLELNRDADRAHEEEYTQQSVVNLLQSSAAYQENATRNGVLQPIVATRSDTRKCAITVLPGDAMCIGDLVFVFDEYWICMELYRDEYGLQYGELWLCNQIFKYQDVAGAVYQKYAILDDGSYSKGSDKAIPVTSNTFNCYVSMDIESQPLVVDKRLAIDIIYDIHNNPILDVGKICWIDTKSRNFGTGSHLLAFGLADDVYSRETDNIEEMICDYVQVSNSDTEEVSTNLSIEGRDKIRIGTGRTYKVCAFDDSGNKINDLSVRWSIHPETQGITLTTKENNEALISVELIDELIGTVVSLECADEAGIYAPAEKDIEVVSIG